MYATINIDLNVPCYFTLTENMINDYPIKKYKLFISYLHVETNKDHMNAIHVQIMNQQDLIKLFPLL